MKSQSKVWEARGVDTVSANVFNAVIGVFAVIGLLIFGWSSVQTANLVIGTGTSLLLIFGSFIGIFVAAIDSPVTKLAGLAMTSGCLGALTGPFVAQYKVASVENIALATVVITCVLGAAGTIYPKSLQNWGATLFYGLLGLIVMQLIDGLNVMYLFGMHFTGLHTLLDWAGVLLFSAIIVYDFNRAQFVPKTFSNAMDIGFAVFLDAINLFIRLLELFGVKTGSSDD